MRRTRKKILIVNCYFPEMREPIRRRNEVPDALAPVLLAGYFSREHCDIQLYNEVNSGFIEVYRPELLNWPDMLVMTGLTATFDRLLHLTAYAKTANPDVITVAGGHAVRCLPRYAATLLDYCCTGDVDEIQEVIREALGPTYLGSEFQPRYDLAYWIKRLGYLESSRNCNFRCSFCSLTGVGRRYEILGPDYLETQMDAMGKRMAVFFSDNQLVGDGPASFRRRMESVQRRRENGQFKVWSGFVTDSFFWDQANIDLAAETGCASVFVGVESFDDSMWLEKANKKQNSRMNQVELMQRCLEAGIIFQYGLVYDPSRQSLEQMYHQLELICDHPEIPGPNFIFMSIPFPGTPFFHERYTNGEILPNTKMRDLEGSTLSLQPIDPVEDVVDFIRRGRNFGGFRRRYLAHQAKFLWHYRRHLSAFSMTVSTLTALAVLAPVSFSSPGALFRKRGPRTHVSTTDRLDTVYTPRLPVASHYESHFQPTWITDERGELNPQLEGDALATNFKRGNEIPARLETA